MTDVYKNRWEYVASIKNPYGCGNAAKIIEKFIKTIDLSDKKCLIKDSLIPQTKLYK